MRTLRASALAPGGRTRLRLAAALLAFTVSTSLLASLLLAFEATAPAFWPAPTPELLQRMAGCERQPERRARDACKQEVVAAQLAREPRPVRLARR